ERLLGRRVVEQDELQVAAGDRAEAAVERLDVRGRLRVGGAEERLAEVRPGVREAADEPLDGGDPDARAPHRKDRVRTLEHDDAGLAERAPDVLGAVRLPVVVAEDGDDRDREAAAGVGDRARLVDLAAAVGVVAAGVEVRGGGDADAARGVAFGAQGYGVHVTSDLETRRTPTDRRDLRARQRPGDRRAAREGRDG